MKNKLHFWVMMAMAALTLASCGQPKETPEQVMNKFKGAMAEVNSAAIAGDLRITGAQDNSDIDAMLNFQSKFDYTKTDAAKSMVDLALKGKMHLAEGQDVSGDVALAFSTIGENFYLKLNKLESDHESVKKIKPLLVAYTGKWLHLSPDLVPENIRQLQKQQAEHRDAVKKVIADSSFFKVDKEYGSETVDGEEAYHYGVTLDQAGIKEYVRKVSIINGRELTVQELEDAVKVLSSVSGAEVWIGSRDYRIRKATGTLDSKQMDSSSDQKGNVAFAFTLNASDYNKEMKIEAPTDAEEFNPFALLMGLSGAQGQMGTNPLAIPPVTPAPEAAPNNK